MAAAAAGAEPAARFEVPEDGDLAPLARSLTADLRPGDVVWLHGDLGVGKTAIVRACARELGVEEPVTSPTYALVHRYRGRVPIVHVDLHRLTGDAAAVHDVAAELDDDAIGFVEWAEVGAGQLPPPTRTVAIALAADGTRVVTCVRGR